MAISSGSFSASLKKATSERLFTNWRLALIGLFAFSIGFYFRALSGSAISDDFQHLAGTSIGGGTVLGALTKPFLHEYYRPLTSLSYLIDFKLWGQDTAMWHLTNIVIHALTASAIAGLAWITLRNKQVAVLAGLFFAVQPAQVGAVAWIGGRTDELSALFATIYLFGLATYFQTGKKWALAGAAITLFLACATKEQNAAFVLAAPIFERAFGVHTKQRAIWSTLAVGIAALAFIVLWVVFYPNPHALAGPGFPAMIRRVVLAYWHYANLLAMPSPRGVTSLSLSAYGWFWLIPATALLVGTPWMVKNIYRFDKRAGAFLLTFLVVYLPVSNIITIPSTQVAPYRIANASVLIALLFGYFMVEFVNKKRWGLVAVFAVNLGLSIGVSLWTIDQWNNEVSWWSASLAFDPHDRLVVKSATSAYMNMPNGSLKSVQTTDDYLDWLYDGRSWLAAVDSGGLPPITPQLKDKLVQSLGGIVETDVLIAQLLNLRGAGLEGAGESREALNCYMAGLRMSPSNGYPAGIAKLLINSDRKTAMKYFRLAVAQAPSFINLFTYGRELLKDGQYRQAEGYLARAMEKDSTTGDVWVELGLAEVGLHNRPKAELCLRTASGLQVTDKDALAKLTQELH
ncbi:MAG TPA: hypothetical protein VG944_02390 [Fimbriimonas sp.]|nr:hypothetical protein [Fimbriimonas sp.]